MKNPLGLFPEKGIDPEQVLALITKKKSMDKTWENGKMYGFVYSPDPTVAELIKKVSLLYYFENAINPALFPSLIYFENQVIAAVAGLLHGDEHVVGNITSGGTESIFLALKAARDWTRMNRPSVVSPEIILPESVHPAFHKAAQCLNLKTVRLPLGSNYRADLTCLPDCITGNTILIAGSAPCYPYGIMDPIEEMGHFAEKRGLLFHVDACLGGFMLPFMEKSGYTIPPFDFRVSGVTSVSADLHKFGYGAKGSSIILYCNNNLRKRQFFVHSKWPGGLFGSPTLLGSRSGAPVAVAWAIINLLGMEGYVQMTKRCMDSTHKLIEGISGIDGLHLVGVPVMSVFSFTSENGNIYQIGEEMKKRGWYLDMIKNPEALHLIVTNQNLGKEDDFLDDLKEVVTITGGKRNKQFTAHLAQKLTSILIDAFPGKTKTLFSSLAAKALKDTVQDNAKQGPLFYGISAAFDNKTDMDETILDVLDKLYKP